MNLKYFTIPILLSNTGYAMLPATQPAAGTNIAAIAAAASNTAAGATAATVTDNSAAASKAYQEALDQAFKNSNTNFSYGSSCGLNPYTAKFTKCHTMTNVTTNRSISLKIEFDDATSTEKKPKVSIDYSPDITLDELVKLMCELMSQKEFNALHHFHLFLGKRVCPT